MCLLANMRAAAHAKAASMLPVMLPAPLLHMRCGQLLLPGPGASALGLPDHAPSCPQPPAQHCRAVNTAGVPQPVVCTFSLITPAGPGDKLRLTVKAVRTTGKTWPLESKTDENFSYTFPI